MFTASEQINDLGYILHILRRPSENVLATAYLTFAREGLLDLVWHAGHVTLSEFLETAKKPNNVYYACFREKIGSPEQVELCGMGWAWDAIKLLPETETERPRHRAEVGMCFFRQFQDRKLTKAFCEMCLDDGFENADIETAIGYSPIDNQAACMFHVSMGFEVSGILPGFTTWKGKITACQVSCMTKQRWNAGQDSRLTGKSRAMEAA